MTTNFLQQLLGRFKGWNHKRATVRALHGLSDWQLRDIGLTRGEIPGVVEAAFETTKYASPPQTQPATRIRVHPQAPASGGRAIAA